MSDIVERLSTAAPVTFPLGALCAEAAAEIERLRERVNLANYRADNLHADLEKANADCKRANELINAAIDDYNAARAKALEEAAVLVESYQVTKSPHRLGLRPRAYPSQTSAAIRALGEKEG